MSKLWRMIAACTVAGSLLAAAGLPALAAPTAVPAITIAASAKTDVGGDALVVYRGGRKYRVASISGDISGATGKNVVKLYAQPFPYDRAARLIGSASEATRYSFNVKPTIATRYHVVLDTSPRAVTSATATVYISANSRVATKRNCVSTPVCHPAYRVYVFLPRALIGRYMSKHWYVYVGLRLSATSNPPRGPKWLYLDKHAAVSGPRRISPDEYERTVRFSLRIGSKSATWLFLACARDSEARDGIGLPGRHDCGVHRVRANVSYLG